MIRQHMSESCESYVSHSCFSLDMPVPLPILSTGCQREHPVSLPGVAAADATGHHWAQNRVPGLKAFPGAVLWDTVVAKKTDLEDIQYKYAIVYEVYDC